MVTKMDPLRKFTKDVKKRTRRALPPGTTRGCFTLAEHALGLIGEAVELQEVVDLYHQSPAVLRYNSPELMNVVHNVLLETGDVLFYCAAMCNSIGMALETVPSSGRSLVVLGASIADLCKKAEFHGKKLTRAEKADIHGVVCEMASNALEIELSILLDVNRKKSSDRKEGT